MRRSTRRSWWSRPRPRRCARSLNAILRLARSVGRRTTSTGAASAASPGNCRTVAPSAVAPSRWGRSRICSRTGSISARWSTAVTFTVAQEPILDRALFEAVQAKLAAQAIERRCRLRGSPALLTGRLFDERGNRMSPSHTNKGGARYRYYVCQAVLQKKPQPAGSIGRVPAAEIEALVITALRNHLQASGTEAQSLPDNERELIEHHVERVMLTPKHIKLQLRQCVDPPDEIGAPDHPRDNPSGHLSPAVTTVTIPWTSPVPAALKGIVHVPAHNTPMKPSRRDALLIAIAKARQWVDDLAHGRAASFAAIARREGRVERHVRLLAPLAF